MLDEVDDVVIVFLLHHFVGGIVGVVNMGVAAVSFAEPFLLCGPMPLRRKHKQTRRAMALVVPSFCRECGVSNRIVRLTRILVIRCCMTRILQLTSAGFPSEWENPNHGSLLV